MPYTNLYNGHVKITFQSLGTNSLKYDETLAMLMAELTYNRVHVSYRSYERRRMTGESFSRVKVKDHDRF